MPKFKTLSSRRKNSKSRSSSAVFKRRPFKVEDGSTKVKKPLEKAGRFRGPPIGSNSFKRTVTSSAEAKHWTVQRYVEAGKACKGGRVWPRGSNPYVTGRLPGGVRPSTNAARVRVGTGTTSASEWGWSQDGDALPEDFGNRPGRLIDPHTTPHDLLRLSEAVEKRLKQDSLSQNFPSNKTGWEMINEAQDTCKYAYSILHHILKEVNDKLERDNPSTSRDSDEVSYTPDPENDELHRSLCNSFDKLSTAASGFCLRAISFVANCIDECQDMKQCATKSLFQTALELMNTCNRIGRVQENMITKRQGKLAVINWSIEQEESRTGHLWKLIEAVSRCVISVQERVLQSALVPPLGTATPKEETSKLESHLQECWIWLNTINKRAGVLCPSRKQTLFVHLLERFIGFTHELSRYQRLLPVSNDAHCKEPLAKAASTCQQMLLRSLMQLFKRAEAAGLKFRKEGLVSAFNFCKIVDAAQIYCITLTLLLSIIAEQGGTAISQSHFYSETLKKYGAELMCFAKPCVDVIRFLASKAAARTDVINQRAGDVIEAQDNTASELPATVDLGAQVGSTGELAEITEDNHEEQEHESLNGERVKRPPRAPHQRVAARIAKPPKLSAFARRDASLSKETPNAVFEASDAPASDAFAEVDFVELNSEEADNSLDRPPPDIPNQADCNRVNIKIMTKVKDLGEGSSGQVILVFYNNSHAAVKFSTCSNLILARHRLEREATVHEKINSSINIVRYLGTAVQTDQSGKDQIIGIITEWCELGDLSKALEEAVWIQELDLDGENISFRKDRAGYRLYKDWIKRLEVAASIAAGMVYMHNHHIVHRDLTTSNVFLYFIGNSGAFGVKIGDFERAYYLPKGEPIQRTNAPANSAPWMGPEVLNHLKYGLKADVYSIGTILWQLMYLESPWTHLSRKRCGADEIAIQCLLSMGKISLSISEEDAPDDVPEFPELVRLVKRAWSRDPEDRPTMAEFHKEIVEICNRMKARLHAEGN